MIAYFSSYFLEYEEIEVSSRDALKDKEPTYDSLIQSKKRRIVFISLLSAAYISERFL